MKIVQLNEKQITGISIRTTNANEINPQSSKIGVLHQKFDATVPVNYKEGARVYGVYYDYESDHNGEFSVLAGADQVERNIAEHLEAITLPAGAYMVFEAKGKVPEIVIETWANIWAYFAQSGIDYMRSYKTDFEYYKNQSEVEIYISVKELRLVI